jgi:hypothetical protein
MNTIRKLQLAAATLGAMVYNAQAARVTTVPEGDGFASYLSGKIEHGDARKFVNITKNIYKAAVILESGGGFTEEGLQIGLDQRKKVYDLCRKGQGLS